MVNPVSREMLSRLSNSVNLAIDLASKLDLCRQLKQDLLKEDAAALSEFLPRLFDLYSDPSGPVRKFATEIIGEIGVKHLEFVTEIAPFLITVLEDATPAVARQSIACSIDLFRHTLEKIAIQGYNYLQGKLFLFCLHLLLSCVNFSRKGLYSSELDSDLESSWSWMLKLKEKIYSIAFQPGSGGIRLVALKFVEAVILLYTPDPNGSPEPPSDGGTPIEFNIAWLRGGHPLLNVGDLSIEASQRLILLLDQLRFPTVKSLTSSVIVVLINSLSAIAKKRPAYYGRILPVLLSLDPPSYVIKGVHVYGAHHALKNALLSCLKCTHPSAAPWRDRLLGALREMKGGGLAELALNQAHKINGSVEEEKDDSSVIKKTEGEEEVDVVAGPNNAVAHAGMAHEAENALLAADLPVSSDIVLPGMEKIDLPTPSDIQDVGNLESEIPGLDSSVHNDGLSDTQAASSLVSTDLEDASQDQVTSFGGRSLLHVLPSISTDRSEELSPKAVVTDSNSMISSTATSVVSSYCFVLPKMSAPVVNLSDDQKDDLQKLAFIRIIEAYKQIAVAGGSQVRFSLLAYMGVELPSELDLQKLLQEHILSDYINHEGHELTLRVLYRLFGEAEEESDFFSCTTAASAYETFLLAVAETLRDSFPPSDKSLSRLLGEAPRLPKSVLNLLEGLCSPGISEKTEKESLSGDRVTQGLSTVWSLILLRPPIRDVCLKIALQSAVHHLEEVRMKAIRLVANKLYPLSSIAQQIEDFAREMVLSVVNADGTERTDAEGLITESRKDSDSEKPSNEHQSMSSISKDISDDVHQSETSQSVSSLSVPEAQRCMSLYFALCTKKHSLFCQIFLIYSSASKAVKQAIHRHIPILVRTMGSSSDLLEIISDPPSGSKNLLMQVLHTLTEGTVPSAELIFTIKKLFDSKLKDVEILVPVLPFLPRDEVLLLFPYLVNLLPDKFQAALTHLLQGSSHSGPVLSPAEVLIAIHGIDPERDGIPLKKVTDACNACFEQRQIFTQQVLAKVLNQLVEQIPLPLLFMRTVLQAIGAFPALVEFIMEILSRLVSKQIWKYPKLWVGFLKCALLTKPQSFSVLLQLPPPQLENALNRTAALKAPLVAYASQQNIRASLPRSVLAVLGLAPDSQSSSQVQTSQALHTGDTSNSEKDAVAEKSKESSSAS
ncbi:symplekin isoform X4 [Durio zibethinus]|uniref:Symplekin isoform X4 n=1 Tax=Durio zibethinus TaxID=66656 RepID=A0A6P5YYM4_DURZI|nr:symplekin isoform X4 [Durio zibethinus]